MSHSTALHAVPRRAPSDPDRPIPVRSFDATRIRGAVRELLLAIGEDPDREGLAGTPDRVARAYGELFGGLLEDPSEHLERTFAQDSEDLVVLRDIELTSCCEHHLLPVRGRASIAYLPAEGLSGAAMKHGPLALIDQGSPVWALVPPDETRERMLGNLRELKARGAFIMAIAAADDAETKALVDHVIPLPPHHTAVSPVLNAVPLQLYAYYVALAKGYNIDKPRNLAKSVTVM